MKIFSTATATFFLLCSGALTAVGANENERDLGYYGAPHGYHGYDHYDGNSYDHDGNSYNHYGNSYHHDGSGYNHGAIYEHKISKAYYRENPFDPRGNNLITCDVVLYADVDCSAMLNSDPCFKMTEGATIDCNGFTIKGPGRTNNRNNKKPEGILVDSLTDGEVAVIKNCNIEGFQTGIHVVDVNDDGMGNPVVIQNNAAACTGDADLGPVNAQCCPGRDSIDGKTIIKSTKVFNNFNGVLTTLANVDMFDLVTTGNSRGLEFERCSNIGLSHIYACGNFFASSSGTNRFMDLKYDGAGRGLDEPNTGFVMEASGTIRIGNPRENTGDSDPETDITNAGGHLKDCYSACQEYGYI